MNKVILMGRLTREPDYRQAQGEGTDFARYTLAVDRRMKKDNNDPNAQTADFISCVVFGKGAQFANMYLHQGTKIAVTGRIQTGSYTNKDGVKVYTTDVVVEDQEFAESKATQEQNYKKQTGRDQQDYQSQQYQAQQYQSQDYNNNYGNTYGAHVQNAMRGNGQMNEAPMQGGFIDIPEGIDEGLPFH